jgi:hypothetical protein
MGSAEAFVVTLSSLFDWFLLFLSYVLFPMYQSPRNVPLPGAGGLPL